MLGRQVEIFPTQMWGDLGVKRPVFYYNNLTTKHVRIIIMIVKGILYGSE